MKKGVFVEKSESQIQIRIVKKLVNKEALLYFFDINIDLHGQIFVLQNIDQSQVTTQKSLSQNKIGQNSFYQTKIDVLNLNFLHKMDKNSDGKIIFQDLKKFFDIIIII